MPRAAILGSGPAGLLAAHACALNGVEPRIFSLGEPSTLYGAQFLGSRVPEIRAPATVIDISMRGTEPEYRAKVYGEGYKGPVSPLHFVGQRQIIDIRYVYRWLWERFADRIEGLKFDRFDYGLITNAMLKGEFDHVFSSLPAKDFCIDVVNHTFTSTKIFACGDAPALDVVCPIRVPERSIVYCGNKDASWYRASNVFDHCTVEWPALDRRQPPVYGTVAVYKPLSTSCTCHPRVVRIGRFGEWKKGVLAFNAFVKVHEHLKKRGVQGVLFN